MTPNTADFYLGRQPILDRAENLHAFELLFRAGPDNHADIVDGVAATAQVIQYAFGELGADVALGVFRGFINIDASLLMNDVLELLPHQLVTLELLETIEITPSVVSSATGQARACCVSSASSVGLSNLMSTLR